MGVTLNRACDVQRLLRGTSPSRSISTSNGTVRSRDPRTIAAGAYAPVGRSSPYTCTTDRALLLHTPVVRDPCLGVLTQLHGAVAGETTSTTSATSSGACHVRSGSNRLAMSTRIAAEACGGRGARCLRGGEPCRGGHTFLTDKRLMPLRANHNGVILPTPRG